MNNNTKTRKILPVALSLMCTIIIAAFPPLFMFFQNAGEAHFRDISSVLLVFTAVGAVLYALLLFLTKKPAKAGVIASLFLLVFLNYASIEHVIQMLLPHLRYWHIVPILLILLLHAAWFIWKKLPDDLADIIVFVFCGVFVVLILFNSVVAAPAINTRRSAEREARLQTETTVDAQTYMPNFYFILFDEFSTIPFMQKYYNYDNTKLLNDLEKLGFNISQSGHNDSNATAVITANLFQLSFPASLHNTEAEWFAMRSNNKVFPLLREAGYEIICPAGASDYGLKNALDEDAKGVATTVDGYDLETLLVRKTVVYPFLKDTGNYIETAKIRLNQLAYMQNMGHFKESNQFVLAHLELPHEPFYFEADGSMSSSPSNDWRNPEPYLNQYKFASDQMKQIAEKLVANDPNAVIWILSDHSARASSDREIYLKKFTMQDMTNFFNAVYYQGKPLDIEGLSGVNTFRLLLNEVLDTSFEMLPLPGEE